MTEAWTHQFNSEADFLDFLKMKRENEELRAKVKYLEKAVDDYANDMVKKNETIGELRRASSWISVKDDLPKDTGMYWCYVEEKRGLRTMYYQTSVGYNYTMKTFYQQIGTTVTFWRELPEPPKQ